MNFDKIKNVYAVYFSPCGNVRQIVLTMAEYAGKKLKIPVIEIDFTLPQQRQEQYIFHNNDLVFFGTPVYAGRVPNKIMPYIRENFIGNGAYAVSIVAFGNRDFDDALMELSLLMEQNNFQTVAGAAVVSQHSFSKTIAADRPNEQDQKDWEKFVTGTLRKLKLQTKEMFHISDHVPGTNPPEKYYTPIGIDGHAVKFLKAVPKTNLRLCNNCGVCAANCPMGSIDRSDPTVINGICIKCHSCIQKCPTNAKYFDDPDFLSHKEMLENIYNKPVQSVFVVK